MRNRAHSFSRRLAEVRGVQRDSPLLVDALRVDRAIPAAPETTAAIAREVKRWSHRYLRPVARIVSLILTAIIVVVKRILPFQFSNHNLIDTLGVWFLRNFVSSDGIYLLLRHFIVETKLINFVTRNCGDPSVGKARLAPTQVTHLYDNAVIQHDINIYNLVLDLGYSEAVDFARARRRGTVDFADLDVPAIDSDVPRRPWPRVDLETGLYVMNVLFCLLTTEDEYERAVNSLQFDESLLAYLSEITGDQTFRTWTPLKFRLWVSIRRDVPRDVYWHGLVNEYAHTRLCGLRDAAVQRTWRQRK